MKSCLFNLIIYTEDKDQIPYLNEIATSLVSKYPARIILINGNEEVNEIKIEKKTLAPNLFEQISIDLPKKDLESISLFVLPFLIPDYPICLFYSGNPVKESPIFNALIRLSNRLIVDSETSDNLKEFCAKILDQITRHKMDVVDLNWARTLGWRLILSNLFDTPEKLKNLSESAEIRIEYHKTAHSLNPVLYLQAWLASCFHWDYLGHNESEISYLHKDGPVKIELVAIENEYQGEAIRNMQITTHDEITYDITLLKDQPQACIHISSADSCHLPYTLYFPNFLKGTSYLTQLLYSTTSKQYADMLPTLKKFYE